MTGVDPSVFRRYFREEEEEDLGESEEGMEISAGGYNRYTVHQYREISAMGYNRYTVQYTSTGRSVPGVTTGIHYTVHQYMEISARGYNRYTVHKYREISAGAGGYNTVHQYKYTALLCFSLKMQLTLYSIQYSNLSE